MADSWPVKALAKDLEPLLHVLAQTRKLPLPLGVGLRHSPQPIYEFLGKVLTDIAPSSPSIGHRVGGPIAGRGSGNRSRLTALL